MMKKHILLLDMDGVLLQPGGYHHALQETVRLVGETLGFQNLTLGQHQISRFEAAGISSEWDSSAICLGLMMRRIWQEDPQTQVPKVLASRLAVDGRLTSPDWGKYLDQLSERSDLPADPLQRAEALLTSGLEQEQAAVLRKLIREAHQPETSLTHRVFQELVLGSRVYRETSELASQLDVQGALQAYDRSQLLPAARKELKAWLAENGQAVIFTNRPSLPPEGNGSPEAELGAELVGLQDLPVVGYGDMAWLGKLYQQPVDDFRKPSPVHALSALLQGVGVGRIPALRSAAGLTYGSENDDVWNLLQDTRWYVLEDTTTGLISARRAAELLAEKGIKCQVNLAGITSEPRKKQPLQEQGAVIFPDLEAALRSLILT